MNISIFNKTFDAATLSPHILSTKKLCQPVFLVIKMHFLFRTKWFKTLLLRSVRHFIIYCEVDFLLNVALLPFQDILKTMSKLTLALGPSEVHQILPNLRLDIDSPRRGTVRGRVRPATGIPVHDCRRRGRIRTDVSK